MDDQRVEGGSISDYPRSLADIAKGSHIDGDTGGDPTLKPEWFDKEEYAKIHAFFEKNVVSLTLAWHCSITIGFSIKDLLRALVFTGASSTPSTSLDRYIDTFKHLVLWHMGDVFRPDAMAFKSVQGVRGLHASVRHAMDQKVGGRTWISMYDMAIVQTGFMGAITVTPEAFGMDCTSEELSTYVYFWRCVGHQLGIADQYNLCGGGVRVSTPIVNEVISQVLLPASTHPPEPDFDTIAGAYIAGINLACGGLPLASVRSVFHFVRRSLNYVDPGPPMSIADWLRYGFLVWSVHMIRHLPGIKQLYNSLLLSVIHRELQDSQILPVETLSCPVATRGPESPDAAPLKGIKCQRRATTASAPINWKSRWTLHCMLWLTLLCYFSTLLVVLSVPAWAAARGAAVL